MLRYAAQVRGLSPEGEGWKTKVLYNIIFCSFKNGIQMRLKVSTLILLMISIGSIILALKASNEPMLPVFKDTWIDYFFQQFTTGNSIIYNLSIGFLVSFFFYLLVVSYPSRQRKNLIRRNFEEQYLSFKHDMICIFLSASEKVYDSDLPSKLTDQSEFRKFFLEPLDNEPRNIKWYSVLNGLKEHHLKDILVVLEIFMNEVAYVLNNVNINDPKVFAFFKRLSQAVYQLKNSNLGYDEIKPLDHFIWEILGGCSIVDGRRDYDVVKIMINKI